MDSTSAFQMVHSQLPTSVLLLLTAVILSICLQNPGSIHAAAAAAVAAAPVEKTINVNLHGGGDFTSIQKAVDSVPDNNDQWIRIHVAAGIYSEKVYIGCLKSKIFLEGEAYHQTSIEWGDWNGDPAGHDTATSATFTSCATNFIVARITFKNTYRGKGSNISQAVAALVVGDKSAFYDCSFVGVQDTLFDYFGRHYFKGCYVEGFADFVFGRARSIYEGCTLSTVVGGVGGPGYITAHGRDKSDDPGGFVFKGCTITGEQEVYLGRAWSPYARVIFYRTFMSDIIHPLGWEAWAARGREKDTLVAESQCSGPGFNLSRRVYWEKKLSAGELNYFVDVSFIDQEGWISAQPSINCV